MKGFSLTKQAKQDLKEIWHYTDKKWGEEQADSYTTDLKQCCKDLCANPSLARPLYNVHNSLRVYCYKHHYMFFLEQGNELLFIAFLHEKMDALRHIQHRL